MDVSQIFAGVDWTQFSLLVGMGLLGGILSGIVGVGGGLIFVPALVYVTGWEIQEAVAASLFIIVFSSLSGTLRNARSADPVDWKLAAALSAAVAPSALIGVAISRISPEVVVQIAFATLTLILAYPTARGRPNLDKSKRVPLPLVILTGVFVGTLSGLVGVGGGVLLVPLLILGFGLRTKRAVSTSLAIVFSTGAVGAIGYMATGFDDLLALPPLIIGAMLGAWGGVRVRDFIPESTLKTGFAIFMVVVALRIFADALNFF